MKTTKKFSIRHFADYHEIVPTKGGKAIVLGLLPAHYGKDEYHGRYFGLFYKGRKPTVKQVLDRLCPKIQFGDFFIDDYNVGVSPVDLRDRVKDSLKNSSGKGYKGY